MQIGTDLYLYIKRNSCAKYCLFIILFLNLYTKIVRMQWSKDTLKEARTSAKLSQPALAETLGVHFRTVQNWEKGATPIPISVSLALDKLFGESQEFVSREEYEKVVSALNSTTEALTSATELNKKLTDIIQSNYKAKE